VSEYSFEKVEHMTVEEMTDLGLYVIAEVVDGIEQMIDCFFFGEEAKEAFNLYKKFNTCDRKAVLRRPKNPRVA